MNRFEFYSRVETFKNSLQHYGIKGQKHGVRRWQNFDGTFNEEGKIRYFGKKTEKNPNGTVFISGSSKTQFDDSPYYRKELPKAIQNQINQYMNQGKTILVGDAPGIDRQVQDYLNQNGYNNVEIYSPGKEVRYNANPKWKTNQIDVLGVEEGSPEWLAGKDKAMTDRADEGLAIVLDNGAQATRNNVARLEEQGKNCDVFQLNEDGDDEWNKHEETFGGFNKTPEEKEMKKARKSLSKKDIDIDDSEVQDKDKLDKSIKSLSNDYEKHNKIVIDKLADMYYKAYQKTYGYEENPISKVEFKETFENIRGTLRPNGILEGYTESDVNDSFSNGYYFNYDVLNKIVSDIESD